MESTGRVWDIVMPKMQTSASCRENYAYSNLGWIPSYSNRLLTEKYLCPMHWDAEDVKETGVPPKRITIKLKYNIV